MVKKTKNAVKINVIFKRKIKMEIECQEFSNVNDDYS